MNKFGAWEPPAVFWKRRDIVVTADELVELEQVGVPQWGLQESRELAALLRAGYTVAAEPTGRYYKPGRFRLEHAWEPPADGAPVRPVGRYGDE